MRKLLVVLTVAYISSFGIAANAQDMDCFTDLFEIQIRALDSEKAQVQVMQSDEILLNKNFNLVSGSEPVSFWVLTDEANLNNALTIVETDDGLATALVTFQFSENADIYSSSDVSCKTSL